MAVKLKINREYKWPVPWSLDSVDDEEAEPQEMLALFLLPTEAQFKAIPTGEKSPMLELVLLSVDGLDLSYPDGKALEADKVKAAIINDPELSKAFYDAFMEMWVKKSHPEILNYLHSNFMELINNSVASQNLSQNQTDSVTD